MSILSAALLCLSNEFAQLGQLFHILASLDHFKGVFLGFVMGKDPLRIAERSDSWKDAGILGSLGESAKEGRGAFVWIFFY
jgi:hypothetical protein